MADQLKITGTVSVIQDAQQVTEKLTKRTFVITTEGNYPETVAFELINDKCDLADTIAVGQQVAVSFNVRGREYNGKYYTNLAAWKVEDANGAQAAAAPAKSANTNPALRATAQPVAAEDDSDSLLPF